MKKSTILIVILACLTWACDKIDGPYISNEGGSDTEVEFPDLEASDLYRRILVEEYTGHRCSNCPNGHAKLQELHDIYGDTLVIVGIHAGSLANTNGDYTYDFRTETGNTLFADFGLNAIPRAFFNRSELNVAVSEWMNTLNRMDISQNYAAIQLINEYSTNKQELTINAKTTMLSEYANPLQIAFYLIEDDVIKPQLNGTEKIEDYVHKHVLRASANGTYGTRLTESGILEKDSAYARAYTLSFENSDWRVENCTVVAILHDPETREVIQTRAKKIVE